MPTQTPNPTPHTPGLTTVSPYAAPTPPLGPDTCSKKLQTADLASLEARVTAFYVAQTPNPDPCTLNPAPASPPSPETCTATQEGQTAIPADLADLQPAELEAMVSGYLATMLWSSVGENGRMLDATHGLDDVSLKAKAKAREACIDFLRGAVAAGVTLDALRQLKRLRGLGFYHLGNDLWLTRNRHGAGFWDRDLGKLGAALSKVAFAMGERDVYLGGDDLIYVD